MKISRAHKVEFMRLLIQMEIPDEDVKGITLMVDEAEDMLKLLKVMEERDYEMTAQELYRAGAEIITGKTIKELIHQ